MINQVKIKLKEQELVIKKSNRALILFEEMTGKNVYDMDGYGDLIKSFYCILKANNRDIFTMDFDTFLDILDEDETPIEVFNDFLQEEAKTLEPESKKKVVKKSQ